MKLLPHHDKPGHCFQVRCVMDDGIPFIIGAVYYAPTGPLSKAAAAMVADTLRLQLLAELERISQKRL